MHSFRTPWLLLTALLLFTVPRPASGCASSEPPAPACGKTLSLAKAVPRVVLLPGGGTFNVPSLVFFDLVDFPPGSGICPSGPYSTTVSLTATCAPGPGGAGSLSAPITPGFTTVTVPVTVGAGPPRLCTITGTATVALADGTTLTARGDSKACIAEPAPGNPAVPRLDMGIVSPEIVRVHPGDQASYRVRVVNNDPTRSFSGTLNVDMVNSSRQPEISGPVSEGTGVFSTSDPFAGDNFPLGLAEDLAGGCLPLPRDPTDPAIPTLDEPISLGPGESIEIDVVTRPWGMCSSGSCGEGTMVLDGDFSDATPGLACAGFAVGVDTEAAPAYQWADAGAMARVLSPPARTNFLTFAGAPTPTTEVFVDLEIIRAALTVAGTPTASFSDVFSAAVTPERGRTRVRFFEPFGFIAADSVDIELELDWTFQFPYQGDLQRLQHILGAPTGFDDVAPVAEALFEILRTGSSDPEAYFELLMQLNAVAIDETGKRRRVHFDFIDLRPKAGEPGFVVRLRDGELEPGPGAIYQDLEINVDALFFTSEEPQNPTLILEDGFESGDLTTWSRVVR